MLPIDILNLIVAPSLKTAQETILHVSLNENLDKVVLYGEDGAIFDSLNLVSFIFILEEKISSELKLEFKLSAEDILNLEDRPFLNANNLSLFLLKKLSPAK